MTCSIVPLTSLVDVVPIVWRTIGCSLPNFTGPAVTVLVGLRRTASSDSQYFARPSNRGSLSGPKASSRLLSRLDGVHRMSSAVVGTQSSSAAGFDEACKLVFGRVRAAGRSAAAAARAHRSAAGLKIISHVTSETTLAELR